MKEDKVIPIFFSCDDSFVKYMNVSIKSIVDNSSKERNYRIHILYTNICDEMKANILKMKKENIDIRFEDVSEHIKKISSKLPIRDYYSHTTYYRMLIPQMFPEYDKVIYIDCDTVVLDDIFGLYDIDIKDNILGVVHDQVVLTIDEFGRYVEEVLGVDRNNYFNAGLLLINSRKFRQERVFDSFIKLLYSYNFTVGQDQDYLNIICNRKVQYIDPKWNCGLFGKIPCEEKDVKIIHYIMFAKPWHYEGVTFEKYFWDYAKKTEVYELLKQELADYTDEQRKADSESGDRLVKMALDEIAREDNYLKLKNSNKLKDGNRIIILEKIAQLEREGRFDVDVEEDPPGRELLPEKIDYLRKKPTSKVKTKLTFMVANKFMNKLIEDKKLIIKEIKGLENYSNLETGAVITCNHFHPFDSFAMEVLYAASKHKKRKLYRVIKEGNYTSFPGFYGMIMRNCNTFPLSSNRQTMKKFMFSMSKALKDGNFMLVYPEQSMWWNYRKPKPLKKGAYTFAAQNNVPILPCFVTMKDSDIIGDDGFYIQEYTIHVAKPIFPDENKTKPENVQYLMNANSEIWKQIYEETYKEPLLYETV